MMKHFKHHPDWQFIDNSINRLPDPRVSIAVVSGWIPLKSDNRQSTGVEPDNFNFAVFDDKPHDLKFIQHSAFYRNQHHGVSGWFSVYVAEERLQSVLFNREMLKIQPQAVWRYKKAKPVRPYIPLLQKEVHGPNKHVMTADERLWQQGYYTNFQHKYFDGDERFLKVVGKPRGFVLDYQPEVDGLGDSNYLEES
jgi:hypothetical protein